MLFLSCETLDTSAGRQIIFRNHRKTTGLEQASFGRKKRTLSFKRKKKGPGAGLSWAIEEMQTSPPTEEQAKERELGEAAKGWTVAGQAVHRPRENTCGFIHSVSWWHEWHLKGRPELVRDIPVPPVFQHSPGNQWVSLIRRSYLTFRIGSGQLRTRVLGVMGGFP